MLHENIRTWDLKLLVCTHLISILSLSYNYAPIYSFINVITKQIVGFKVYALEVFGGNFDQNHARGWNCKDRSSSYRTKHMLLEVGSKDPTTKKNHTEMKSMHAS